MIRFTCLPKQVANWLHVLRPMFRHRHHRVFCWLLVCQAVDQDKATRTGLARLTPRPIAERQFRRLLTAIYGKGRVLLWWVADQVVSTLPPPEEGVCSLVVDSTLQETTGQRHPLAQKGRLNAYRPYICGLHMVIVMLHGGNDRIPGDGEIVRRTDELRQRAEHRLCRWMLGRFRRPAWAEMVMVVADAALASTANLQLIQRRGYFLVRALARTWCVENGHRVTALVRHVPNTHDRRCWVPLEEPGRRRTDWTSMTRARLRHLGDVTIILSQPRRNYGPKRTNILVTKLPDVTARQVVDIYRRRWAVELLLKALKGATGLGQHQVPKEPPRVERSVAISLMA